MEIYKRNNAALPMFNGKELLGQQSKDRNKHFTILYVYCLHQFILRKAGGKEGKSNYCKDAGS
jgi:hypothetical protein